LAGSRDLLIRNAGNTVGEIDPTRVAGVRQVAVSWLVMRGLKRWWVARRG
jgi:hypothetical protein